MPIVTILHDRPSTASALNDDGLVVGNNDRGPFVWRSTDATWTRGSIVELKTFSEHPEGKGTATAINQQSDVVGFCEAIDSNGELVTRAALWPAGAIEPVPLGTLQPAHDAGEFRGNSRAFGINDSGQIVGVSDSPSWTRAFIFDPMLGGMFELPRPSYDVAAAESEALAINNSGAVIGSHRVHRGARMVRAAYRWQWQPGSPTGHPLHGMGENDVARAINSHGVIVGDARPGNPSGEASVAMRFGPFESTPIVESRFSTALAINDDGVVVGAEGQDMPRAYRLMSGLFHDLSALGDGLRIVRAVDINSRGQIAAVATDGTQNLAVLITF